MEALKTIYKNIPPIIPVPKEFVNKKGEVIFIMNEGKKAKKAIKLKDFYGMIPDFPERTSQSDYENRASL